MPQDFSARIIAWSGDLQTVQALLALLAVGLLMLVVLALRLRRALSAGGARETALQSRLQDADGRVHALELQIGQHEVRAETQRARLGELAEERDGLTDTLNRRSLHQQAGALLARMQHGGEPVTLIMVDADHFKRINDEFGHQTL